MQKRCRERGVKLLEDMTLPDAIGIVEKKLMKDVESVETRMRQLW